MTNLKIPAMTMVNGLQLTDMEPNGQLTELENNLIAQIINFQYLFCLPKSRWTATKKQMISVPVPPENVIDTVQQLPRIPREAGMVPVQLKRKMKYNRNHRKEFINPDKIIQQLNYFKRLDNPYYQFSYNISSYQQRRYARSSIPLWQCRW